MAIDYNWTCTACGAMNAAGTNICGQCASNAVTSSLEIDTGANTTRRPPLSTAQRTILVCSGTALFVGIFVVRVFSSPALFAAGLGLIVLGLIVGGAARVLSASIRRVK